MFVPVLTLIDSRLACGVFFVGYSLKIQLKNYASFTEDLNSKPISFVCLISKLEWTNQAAAVNIVSKCFIYGQLVDCFFAGDSGWRWTEGIDFFEGGGWRPRSVRLRPSAALLADADEHFSREEFHNYFPTANGATQGFLLRTPGPHGSAARSFNRWNIMKFTHRWSPKRKINTSKRQCDISKRINLSIFLVSLFGCSCLLLVTR